MTTTKQSKEQMNRKLCLLIIQFTPTAVEIIGGALKKTLLKVCNKPLEKKNNSWLCSFVKFEE